MRTYRLVGYFPKTVSRPSADEWNMLDTLESLGEVTTHLSVIGMTTIRNGR